MATDCPLSIIIPAWNGDQFILDCLKSLCQTIPDNAEIIVIDNGSTDQTSILAASIPRVRLIRNEVNLGFSAAINQGLVAAIGDILFLLNQDTVAHAGWFAPIQQRFQQDARLGIVGCKLLYPDGTLQHAGGQLLEPSWLSEHVTEKFDGSLDFVTGAAFAIRRACYQEIGLFDIGYYPAYYEDVDYCLRTQLKGWRIACELSAQFTHFESQSRGTYMNQWIMHGTQRLRLVVKHGSTTWFQSIFVPGELNLIKRNLARDWWLAMAVVYLRTAKQLQSINMARQSLYGNDDFPTRLDHLHQQLFLLRQAALEQFRAS